MSSTRDESVAIAATATNTSQFDDDDDDNHSGMHDTDHEDDGIHEGEHEPEDQEWDEGGPSQCGYSETVHDTLMSVGKSVHGVVGGPSEVVEDGMKAVGGWFQEASYAVRDYVRGNKELEDDSNKAFTTMKEDAYSAVSDIMGSGKAEEGQVITAEGATPKQ